MNEKVKNLTLLITQLSEKNDPRFLIEKEKIIIEEMKSLLKERDIKQKYTKEEIDKLVKVLGLLLKTQMKSAKIFDDFKKYLEKK
tara:strand:+ start:367 stop:621 length:255 start_codon:yes stop_codon:yes gene_type:complete